jgi:hypothetical protein
MSGSAFAVHRANVHHRRFRWLRWNPMFRPSHESLLIQNAEINRLDLPRIQNETELEALKARFPLEFGRGDVAVRSAAGSFGGVPVVTLTRE